MTGNYVFASPATVMLDWTSYGMPGGGGGGGTSVPSGLVVSIAFGFPSITTQGTELKGLLNVTWTGYPTIWLWNVKCDAPYEDWQVGMPEGLPFTLNMNGGLGEATLNVTLFVPKNATTGTLFVPCVVTLSTSQGTTKTIRTVITLDVAAPSVNVPNTMIYFFLAPLLLVAIVVPVFRRRKRNE